MNHRERAFWQWLDGKIGNLWHAQRHEDKHSVGIPDVSYGCRGTQGWIELKSLTAWPRKGFPALSVEQANWLTRRGKVGGNCYLLAEIDDFILLIGWERIGLLELVKCREDLVNLSRFTTPKHIFDVNYFIHRLTDGRNG